MSVIFSTGSKIFSGQWVSFFVRVLRYLRQWVSLSVRVLRYLRAMHVILSTRFDITLGQCVSFPGDREVWIPPLQSIRGFLLGMRLFAQIVIN